MNHSVRSELFTEVVWCLEHGNHGPRTRSALERLRAELSPTADAGGSDAKDAERYRKWVSYSSFTKEQADAALDAVPGIKSVSGEIPSASVPDGYCLVPLDPAAPSPDYAECSRQASVATGLPTLYGNPWLNIFIREINRWCQRRNFDTPVFPNAAALAAASTKPAAGADAVGGGDGDGGASGHAIFQATIKAWQMEHDVFLDESQFEALRTALQDGAAAIPLGRAVANGALREEIRSILEGAKHWPGGWSGTEGACNRALALLDSPAANPGGSEPVATVHVPLVRGGFEVGEPVVEFSRAFETLMDAQPDRKFPLFTVSPSPNAYRDAYRTRVMQPPGNPDTIGIPKVASSPAIRWEQKLSSGAWVAVTQGQFKRLRVQGAEVQELYANPQPSRVDGLEEAGKVCDELFEESPVGQGGSYEEGRRDAFDLAATRIRARVDQPHP